MLFIKQFSYQMGFRMIRHSWTIEELRELYELPLIELISKSHRLHSEYHPINEIQVCSLISIKTGGCPEDCKYCAQSSRYQTFVVPQPLLATQTVIDMAKRAIENGASRVCLGAAWREVRDSKQFEEILRMVKRLSSLGVEVCCTLGMLKESQARRLKEAGLHSYNHNLDTSEKFYSKIVTTRTYQDRLNTLDNVEKADLHVCCGAILGMGEDSIDWLEFLLVLCRRDQHPQSVPINRLMKISGTPLQDQPNISFWDMLRLISVARIALPQTMIRLSAGRIELSYEQQGLCFLAGANSIFAGEKLLTVANHPIEKDDEMFHILGLKKRLPYANR